MLNKFRVLVAALLLVSSSAYASTTNPYTILFDEAQLKCLVKNIYYESRNQPVKGQEAVALVTINRLKRKDFPNTVCEVVYEKKQFSWTSNKKLSVKNKAAWEKAKSIALRVIMGNHSLGNFKAINFHATYVNPDWNMVKVAKIADHIFYK